MENQSNKNESTPSTADSNDLETLEATTTVVEDQSTSPNGSPNDTKSPAPSDQKKKKARIKTFAARFNIYLLLFIFLIIIALVVTALSVLKNKQVSSDSELKIKTEPLSKEALDQLRQTDVKVGDAKQVLSVESNAIFAGRVLIRDSLEVAGEIKTGSPLSIPGLNVSGTANFSQIQGASLQISGNSVIQGQLAVQNNLSVTGSATFGGVLTASRLNIQDLQINGDLQFTKHIDAGGGTPGKADGSALGSGGTSSISGTDTAGTVAINTGGNTSPGCFVTINFVQRFNGVPHVVITPVGAAGGNVDYYINRTSNNFSICTSNSAPTGQSFAFDYIVVD